MFHHVPRIQHLYIIINSKSNTVLHSIYLFENIFRSVLKSTALIFVLLLRLNQALNDFKISMKIALKIQDTQYITSTNLINPPYSHQDMGGM